MKTRVKLKTVSVVVQVTNYRRFCWISMAQCNGLNGLFNLSIKSVWSGFLSRLSGFSQNVFCFRGEILRWNETNPLLVYIMVSSVENRGMELCYAFFFFVINDIFFGAGNSCVLIFWLHYNLCCRDYFIGTNYRFQDTLHCAEIYCILCQGMCFEMVFQHIFLVH